MRAHLRSPLHAKACRCWYEEGHAEQGAVVVGSSILTLAGFEGNTELNVRVTGDAEMTALKEWLEDLWKDSEDIAYELIEELKQSWVLDLRRPLPTSPNRPLPFHPLPSRERGSDWERAHNVPATLCLCD